MRPALSVTRAVNVKFPAALGLPLKAPETARFRPAGKFPFAIDQAYGGVPPDALICCVNCAPLLALLNAAVVIVRA